MANSYINSGVDLTTASPTTVYTCPSDTTAIIKSLHLCNDSGSDATVDIQWTDSSNGDAVIMWSSDLTVSSNKQIEALASGTAEIDGQSTLILEESDVLTITANASNRVHVTAAVLQVDNFKRFREAGTTT
tara:strand:- start:141 stop:533 length:393 start_codon:yes stop_codon:yes gene_type:complete